MSFKPLIIMAVFSLLTSSTVYAQKQKLIGLNLYTNLYPDEIRKAKLKFGATFETQCRKHSGGETGIFFRSEQSANTVSTGSGTNTYTVTRRYITVPLLYKYYSKSINLSAGPAFDYYLGWKQTDNEPTRIQSYRVNPKARIGFLTKAGKAFSLDRNFIIEPEIRFGSVRFFDNATVGIGIGAKYRF